MIKRFRSKGLKRFYLGDDASRINPAHAAKLRRQLDRLDASRWPQDMALPGWNLRQLTGKLKGSWEVDVSGNCRLYFRFEGEDAVDVDYGDFHGKIKK
jgi:toxin HigB-1